MVSPSERRSSSNAWPMRERSRVGSGLEPIHPGAIAAKMGSALAEANMVRVIACIVFLLSGVIPLETPALSAELFVVVPDGGRKNCVDLDSRWHVGTIIAWRQYTCGTHGRACLGPDRLRAGLYQRRLLDGDVRRWNELQSKEDLPGRRDRLERRTVYLHRSGSLATQKHLDELHRDSRRFAAADA